MSFKNGNVNRHLGGKKAARTRAHNDHIRQFGFPDYNEKVPVQQRAAPTTKVASPIQPTRSIIHGKITCDICRQPIDWFGFNAHYNLKHIAGKSNGGRVDKNSAANKPAKGEIRAKDKPAPTPAANNNNTTAKPALHQNCVSSAKYKLGDQVMLNVHQQSKIRTNIIQREILGVLPMPSGYFYKLANGTNTTGNSYHYYSERRITLIEPIATPVAEAPAISLPTPIHIPKPRPKIIEFPFANVRTRRHNIHPRLSNNKLCRSRATIR